MLTGVTVRRIHGDRGYRGHNYSNPFKVWISGQVRRVTKAIRREMRRRAAIEPIIDHLKEDHRMRRKHQAGWTENLRLEKLEDQDLLRVHSNLFNYLAQTQKQHSGHYI
jgi:hypothetical protein